MLPASPLRGLKHPFATAHRVADSTLCIAPAADCSCLREPMTSELHRLNDPNYAISLAVGPPFPDLRPQSPGSGVVLSGRYSNEPRR